MDVSSPPSRAQGDRCTAIDCRGKIEREKQILLDYNAIFSV